MRINLKAYLIEGDDKGINYLKIVVLCTHYSSYKMRIIFFEINYLNLKITSVNYLDLKTIIGPIAIRTPA